VELFAVPSQDTAGPFALHQICDLLHGGEVEVELDGVLEAGRGHRVVEGLLGVYTLKVTVNKTEANESPRTNAVDRSESLFGGHISIRPPVLENAIPFVDRSGKGSRAGVITDGLKAS
jgi:hypothetical protein